MSPFRNQKIILVVLIAVMAVVAASNAIKTNSGALRFKVRGDMAYGYGTTTSWSLLDFRQFLKNNPQVQTLVLDNMPGTEDGATNLKIARLIRDRGLNTHLTRRSRIASGAVDLFIAGNERTMECGALIGVHSWSIHTEGRPRRNHVFYPGNLGRDRFQKTHETFLSDMGVDPAFYVFTREAASPEDIYFLTPQEIRRFGLLTQDAGC